jgi:probable phosphoglycerate mutase
LNVNDAAPERMATLLLVRHGETDWNRDNRFQGRADPPLNARGRAQAAQLAEELADDVVHAVYSSPRRRALETAQIVAARLDLAVTPVAGLSEIDVGEWQGLTRDEVAERYPEAFTRWLELGPGWERGETYEQLGERVLAAIHAIADRHAGERVVAVTHGGPLRALYAASVGVSYFELRRRAWSPANCSVARFEILDGTVRSLASDSSRGAV